MGATDPKATSLADVEPSDELARARRVEERLRARLDWHRRAIGETAAKLDVARQRREGLERAETEHGT